MYPLHSVWRQSSLLCARHVAFPQPCGRLHGHSGASSNRDVGRRSFARCDAIPYGDVGDRFGVSRTHVRTLLAAAEQAGLVKLHALGGRRVEILARLWSTHGRGIAGGARVDDRWFAPMSRAALAQAIRRARRRDIEVQGGPLRSGSLRGPLRARAGRTDPQAGRREDHAAVVKPIHPKAMRF